MKRFFIAATLAAMLPASFAMADEMMMEPAMMVTQMTMIQNTVAGALKENGIVADVATLTTAQLVEIISAMNMANAGTMNNDDLKGAIEAAIARK